MLILYCFIVAASFCILAAFGDVPVGVCHQCEVTCFTDCANKYNREIIEPEQREYELKQRMLRENGGGHLSARGLAGVRLASRLVQRAAESSANVTTKAVSEGRSHHIFSWRASNPDAEKKKLAKKQELARSMRFAACLERSQCPSHSLARGSSIASHCPQFVEPPASLLALRGSGTAVNGRRGSQCAMRCADEIAQDDLKDSEEPSLLEAKGPFPNYPVRHGMFAKGVLNLDFCLKSCLAVTCGCSDAPGFDAIDQLFGQIKNNIKVGFPVEDTNPEWQYHPATMADCAKGHPGKKINEKLFIFTGSTFGDGGWVEVCTTDLISSIYGPAYPDTKQILTRCQSEKVDDSDFGCVWNNKENMCLVGFVPMTVECQVRGKRDMVENTEQASPGNPAQSGEYLAKANDLMDRYAADGDDMRFD